LKTTFEAEHSRPKAAVTLLPNFSHQMTSADI